MRYACSAATASPSFARASPATSIANTRRCGAPSAAATAASAAIARVVGLTDREQRVRARELGRDGLGRRAGRREHARRGGEARERLARAPALGEHGAEVELGGRRGVYLADIVEPARGVAIAIAREGELAPLLRDHPAQRERAPDGRAVARDRAAELERGERAVRVVEVTEVERREPERLRAQAANRRAVAVRDRARLGVARAGHEQPRVRPR